MTIHRTRDFLIDRPNGLRSHELIFKYHLSEKRLEQILRLLKRSDLVALRMLCEQEKFTDAEFSRTFYEVENGLTIEE